MSDTAIKVEHLSKQYKLGERERYKSLREVLARAAAAPLKRLNRNLKTAPEYIWALDDVSFEVKQGEAVGIIGRNGAGKSTLLKVLSRITKPTKGKAIIYGRVGSLLEVGTGFHPELTGRENIYLNGAILGMKRNEIQRKFDEIVDFAEIDKFLDTPVKRYSSGMYVRLAFAVAAYLEPEILLVDEVLAVGDAPFQKKCLGKMGEVANEGRTVLFVSHNMGSIQALCRTAILLSNGKIAYKSSPNDVINTYLSDLEKNSQFILNNRYNERTLPLASFTGIQLLSENGKPITSVLSGQTLDILLKYRTRLPDLRMDFAIGIYDIFGDKIIHLGTTFTKFENKNPQNSNEIVCHIPKLPLPEGRYRINISLHCGGERTDHVMGALIFDVYAGDFYGSGKIPDKRESKVLVDHTWI